MKKLLLLMCALLLLGCVQARPMDEALARVAGSRTVRGYEQRTGKPPAIRFDRQEGTDLIFAIGENQPTHFATSDWLKVDDIGALWIYDVAADQWHRE